MISRTLTSKRKTMRVGVLAVAFVLSAALFCGCASQPASSGEASSSQSGQVSAIDTSGWKTVGDALATKTATISSNWDDRNYVTIFQANDSYFRIVAAMNPTANEKADAVDCCSFDYDEQVEEAVGGLALTNVEDITGDKASQAELDGLVGKTGKELADAGYTFEKYRVSDGDETRVQFDKGLFSYLFTFDVPAPSLKTKDDGAAIWDAAVKSAEFLGAAKNAVDAGKL